MKPTTRAATLLSMLLTLGAACGGSATDSEPESVAAAKPAVAEALNVVADEFGFSGGAWTIPADTDVEVHFANRGSVEHEWAVLNEGRDIGRQSEFSEDRVLLEVEAIAWDSAVDQTIRVDEPGTYQVICALHGHFDAGMVGTLYVEAS